jgi:RNA-directed DNA polymerase
MKPLPEVIRVLNRLLGGWANYFSYGSVSLTYRSVDVHVYGRMRNFLRRRHKVSTRGTRVFGWDRVFGSLGVVSLDARRRGRNAVSLA